MLYLYLKALHIIFVICWFSGIFYIVRLFVYYAEAQTMNNTEKKILTDQYKIMTTRLWSIITYPSAILSTVFGIWMLIENSALLQMPWMHLKLLFVLLFWLYHFKCGQFVHQIKRGVLSKSGNYFRFWNEGATIILFAVVFIVILKNSFSWIFGLVGLFVLAILLMLGIRLYKRIREKKEQKQR